jgi:hypothetical protein
MSPAGREPEDKTMQSTINEVAEILATYSKELAAAWLTQPRRRVDLACAFSRGLVDSPEDDPKPIGSLVIRVAMLDQRMRGSR